jgi:hypothetical protein
MDSLGILIAVVIIFLVLLFFLLIFPRSLNSQNPTNSEHFDNPILKLGNLKHSEWNTKKVKCSSCQEGYKVHSEYPDKISAAKLMAEINRRNLKLIEHMRQKYISKPSGFNPDKTGAIDVIPMAQMFSEEHNGPATSEYLQDRVNQLIKNYDSDSITEISPLNSKGNTSYTENKKHLVLCLREKQADARGMYNLHDINTMMFVVVHELAHMGNANFGHTENFWSLFKFMLENAVEAGIYIPVDYSRKPILYCGLLLSYNPLFDKNA